MEQANSILALLADLYAQVGRLMVENGQLRQQIAEAAQPPPPLPPEGGPA
jgi:hypothetical protein